MAPSWLPLYAPTPWLPLYPLYPLGGCFVFGGVVSGSLIPFYPNGSLEVGFGSLVFGFLSIPPPLGTPLIPSPLLGEVSTSLCIPLGSSILDLWESSIPWIVVGDSLTDPQNEDLAFGVGGSLGVVGWNG